MRETRCHAITTAQSRCRHDVNRCIPVDHMHSSRKGVYTLWPHTSVLSISNPKNNSWLLTSPHQQLGQGLGQTSWIGPCTEVCARHTEMRTRCLAATKMATASRSPSASTVATPLLSVKSRCARKRIRGRNSARALRSWMRVRTSWTLDASLPQLCVAWSHIVQL